MALQLSYSDEFGNTNASAYHRVVKCDMDWEDKKARVVVYTYKDVTARTDGKKPVREITYRIREQEVNGMPTFDSVFSDSELDATGETPLANAYTFLKSLDEYSDAQDV